MPNEKPLVSVVIPTFNRTSFLKTTLESVLGQTYPNIEIIVIDDGSSGDNNMILCEGFSNVEYFKIKNTGNPCKPRNIGLNKAKGEYLAFLDDDDIWLPNKIERQVEILEKHKDFGLVHSYCKVIDKNGIETGRIIGRPRNKTDKHGYVVTRMIGNWTLMMPTPLIRKRIVEEVGGFNENMPHAGEDVEYWSRCAFYTQFFYLDEPLAKYRLHETNASNIKKAYINLPVYLFKVVKDRYNQGMIDRETFNKLKINLCLSLNKNMNKGVLKTIENLFKIDSLWFVNFRIQKAMLKKIIS